MCVSVCGSGRGWFCQTFHHIHALNGVPLYFQITDHSTLTMFGSLVVGVPSSVFGSISGTELITASQDPTFLMHLSSAPTIVQQTFVTQVDAPANDTFCIPQALGVVRWQGGQTRHKIVFCLPGIFQIDLMITSATSPATLPSVVLDYICGQWQHGNHRQRSRWPGDRDTKRFSVFPKHHHGRHETQ